ncbi:MAG: hypothetical protein RJA76_136 [Bacteroidota bacterium]
MVHLSYLKLVVSSFNLRRSLLIFFLILSNLIFAQWQKINLETKASFRALKVSGNHLWAGGTKGTILHFENSLDHPQVIQVPGASTLDFRDIAILPDQQLLAMSAGPSEQGAAVVFYSNDLGKTWLKVFELKEPGYFFDAILYDSENSKGYLLSDPINQQLTLFEFDLNLEFKQINMANMPYMLSKEAFFAASGSSMVIHQNHLYLITGGSEKARIWRSKDLQAKEWEIVNEEVSAGANKGFFSIACSTKECLVAGGDYTKLNESPIPMLIGTSSNFKPFGSSPGFYVEKVLLIKKSWWATGPAGTSIFSNKTKSWIFFDKTPLHNIVIFKKWIVGIGKEVVKVKS